MVKFEMICYNLINGQVTKADLQTWQGGKRISETEVRDARVSTVFLGTHHHGGMFETMVFGGPLSETQYRTSTIANARTTHARIVQVLRSANWLQWYLNDGIAIDLLEKIKNQLTKEKS